MSRKIKIALMTAITSIIVALIGYSAQKQPIQQTNHDKNSQNFGNVTGTVTTNNYQGK